MNNFVGNMSLGLIYDQLNEMNARAGYTDRCTRAQAIIVAASSQLGQPGADNKALGEIIREAQNVLLVPPPNNNGGSFAAAYGAVFTFARVLFGIMFGIFLLFFIPSLIVAISTYGAAEMMPFLIFVGIVIVIGIGFVILVRHIAKKMPRQLIEPRL